MRETILLVAMLVACTPAQAEKNAADSPPSPRTGAFPEVTVQFSRIQSQPGGQAAALLLRNESSEPVIFSGYSADGPVFRRQCLTDQWAEDEMGWCGTGLETQTLAPKTSVSFLAPMCPENRPTRIGVSVGDKPGGATEIIWSKLIAGTPG